MIEQFIERFINGSYSDTRRRKKGHLTKKMKWHVGFVKTKNSLITQIQIKKIELAKFLHERKVSKFDHSNCSYGIDEQTSKYIIMNCVLIFDTFNIWLIIENDEKKMYEKLMFNFKTIKILIQWFIKSDLMSMFFFVKIQFYWDFQ